MSRGATLKGAPSSLPGCLSPPGCRPDAGDGCDKPRPGSTTMKTPLGSPADSASKLYVRTDISPEQIFQAIGRLRKDARDEIDRLIRFLDATDNHMEREPDDDEPEETEPSLGSLDRAADQTRWG